MSFLPSRDSDAKRARAAAPIPPPIQIAIGWARGLLVLSRLVIAIVVPSVLATLFVIISSGTVSRY
jgi:hypothetical protein